MKRVLLATAVAVSGMTAITTSGAMASAAKSGWSVVATPSPSNALAGDLGGVACSGTNACTAVGQFQTNAGASSLAERWNGTAFSTQQTPNPSSLSTLSAVSCPA